MQQNTFDKVDSTCGAKRQEYVFDKLLSVLRKSFNFPGKNEARTYFQRLRQRFLDWNYAAWESEAFQEAEAKIDEMLASQA